MECKYCKNTFSTKTNLNYHQNTAKYCLKIQGKPKESKYKCEMCDKKFGKKFNLIRHEQKCVSIEKFFIMKEKLVNVESENTQLEKKVNDQQQIIKDQLRNSQEQISCLQKALENCALEAINQQKDKKKANEIRIKYLEKKYLKKQKRIEYKEKNVIYILTTNLMQKERRYIMGKATNLTNRLSTYNKSDEHVVIYFQECPDKETMDIVETVIFQKLKKFREKANRERFILPHDKEITFFQDMIHKCIEFQI